MAATTWLPMTADGLANQVTASMPSAACTYCVATIEPQIPSTSPAPEAGVPQGGDAGVHDQRSRRDAGAVAGVGREADAGDGDHVPGRVAGAHGRPPGGAGAGPVTVNDGTGSPSRSCHTSSTGAPTTTASRGESTMDAG